MATEPIFGRNGNSCATFHSGTARNVIAVCLSAIHAEQCSNSTDTHCHCHD